MVVYMADLVKKELTASTKETINYEANKAMEVPEWL